MTAQIRGEESGMPASRLEANVCYLGLTPKPSDPEALSLRSLAIWFNDVSPVATELSRDWRNPAAVNLRELRMINRVWLAMRSRSGRLGHERP